MRYILLSVALKLGSGVAANHVYGGEIRYVHQSGYMYVIDVVLFVRSSSVDTSDQVLLEFGDNTYQTIGWTDSELLQDDSSCLDLTRVTYSAQHFYLGPGSYTILARVQNRNEGILNIPNSVDQELCLRASLVIDPILGPNNSVRFTAPQNDIGYAWSTLVHRPLAVDPDGDSLSFEFVEPHGVGCGMIPGYGQPYEVMPSTSTWNIVDTGEGNFLWYFPQQTGEYVIGILAREWRNGTGIGSVIRDMTICYGGPFSVTGLSGQDGPDVFQVYPSAEAGVFRIVSTSRMTLLVHDALGRNVQEQRLSQGEQMLDLRGNAAGSYALVALSGNGGRSSRRVVLP